MRVLSFVIAALLLAAAPAAGQTLVPVATVSSPVVHIGDIFSGAGAHAGDALVPAPPPGTRITYGADWLQAMAREHGLAWVPGSSMDQVTIERASRVIDADAITEQLMQAIAARESVANATLELENRTVTLIVPADAPDAIAIDGLTVDRRTGSVSAMISAPPDDPAAMRRRIVARLVYRVPTPVLTHSVGPGTIIGAADVDTVLTRRDRLGADAATDPAQLIGKTPRHALEPGAPVRLADLAEPILVHRNELVTLVFETGNLRLSSQGKSLDDGAAGALVRVQNTTSTRVIDATVVSAGLAAVATAESALAAQHVAQQ